MQVQPSLDVRIFIWCHSEPSTLASVGFCDHVEDRQKVEPVPVPCSWASEAKEKPTPSK